MKHFSNKVIILLFVLLMLKSEMNAMVAGGRPNAVSDGINAFAGVVNPANAVWIKDRLDVGMFFVHQKSCFNNKDDNPRFNSGKINQTYKSEIFFANDAAIHKRAKIKNHDVSISFATYITPGFVQIRTKKPVPITGKTPVLLRDKTRVISSVFSFKLSQNHSFGFSLDYFYLSHVRKGFQNADNILRSVSPGNVTNNGIDHSSGLGMTFGWRWKISKKLDFGLAYIKKSYVGQYRKYRGFEPHHAKNYIPRSLGGGFTYKFNKRLAGRFEVLWTNLGSLPNSNNAILSNGNLNTNRRGSKKSPGSGLQDATIINMGLGYKVNEHLSVGSGFSHRIRLKRKSPYIISHSYLRQVTFNLITFGINYNYHKNDFFLTFTHAFNNHQKGLMPGELGGGNFSSEKTFNSLSVAWGYLY